jgi:hypothetical protein
MAETKGERDVQRQYTHRPRHEEGFRYPTARPSLNIPRTFTALSAQKCESPRCCTAHTGLQFLQCRSLLSQSQRHAQGAPEGWLPCPGTGRGHRTGNDILAGSRRHTNSTRHPVPNHRASWTTCSVDWIHIRSLEITSAVDLANLWRFLCPLCRALLCSVPQYCQL